MLTSADSETRKKLVEIIKGWEDLCRELEAKQQR